MKPAECIERLLIVAPCPVRHELPHGWRPMRSCYYPNGQAPFQDGDLIYMNEPAARAWKYVQVLCHEVGHALDYHNVHPCQEMMGRASLHQSRYRDELAAVSFEVIAARAFGMERMVLVRRRLRGSRNYLFKYIRPRGCPVLADIVTDEVRERTKRMLLFDLPRHLQYLNEP